ncbi:Diphthine--ammonia ligase [Tolypocladium paradoxum]|uniref:Diphthine--ammonia ligase n=1 Tax=Tolypocladium paradoxum TaxID=94208 RepID=A0A2S4KPH7_9HYPO|nr:Diphthine--ammonia ligase [Tolypocladium paradoxum]
MSAERLNVIALISGGKDSFYSLLHCIHHGHRIVALANLFPATSGSHGYSTTIPTVQVIDPAEQQLEGTAQVGGPPERDLNSFMYQTVGHEVIPLYAAATDIPLYRQPIVGGAVRHERDYHYDRDHGCAADAQGSVPFGGDDETESMLPLLQAIRARHPDANALCSGAILSTYQRTRVESVALRLGLAPLSYLWKYPVLPGPSSSVPADEAQLLRDMATAGLEARIVKVASAGLDERHLWERVTSDAGVDRVKAALRRFGAAEGASLGEGGEFETVVVDGPARLFKKRIVVPESGRAVVPEGGGSTWLMLRGARLDAKPARAEGDLAVREPALLDAKFQSILESVLSAPQDTDVAPESRGPGRWALLGKSAAAGNASPELLHWSVLADSHIAGRSIQEETSHVVETIRSLLSSASQDSSHITNTIIMLRDMSDFPKVNEEYGKLFTKPNPPSRITISCGDVLPAGRNIAVHITMPNVQGRHDRDGLHVQSRSYWAPANIGPYSQAIEIPVTAGHEPTGLGAVYVAGQIPLIPASMSLPPSSHTSLQQQIVLSLQHLWRIGAEMKIQYWTSAVAYFARPSSADDMEQKAKLAGRAWRLIHAPPEGDEEAESGPDPWDLKYNPRYMSLGGSDQQSTRVALPDWSIFTLRQQNEPESCVPPFFAVEIASLPRQSAVEWHAHTGLKKIDESSLETVHLPEVGAEGWRGWHVIVRTAGALVVHTVLARERSSESGATGFRDLKHAMGTAHRGSLERLGVRVESSADEAPCLSYVDTSSVESLWQDAEGPNGQLSFAVVPCHSLWSSYGERLGCVALYRRAISAYIPGR